MLSQPRLLVPDKKLIEFFVELTELGEELNESSLSRVHARGGHATARFLEGFLEGSLKEVLLRRVLRRHVVRASVGTGVLRRSS